MDVWILKSESSEIALLQVMVFMCGQRKAFNEPHVLVQEGLAQSTEQEHPAVMALH